MKPDPQRELSVDDLLPEFKKHFELVNHAYYVVAQLGPGGVLNIYSHHPRYLQDCDSWAFPNNVQARTDEDYWLPVAQLADAMARAEERRQMRLYGTFTA